MRFQEKVKVFVISPLIFTYSIVMLKESSNAWLLHRIMKFRDEKSLKGHLILSVGSLSSAERNADSRVDNTHFLRQLGPL